MSSSGERPPLDENFEPLEGEYTGWTLHIQSIAGDGSPDEGYLILKSRGSEAFDDWVADEVALDGWIRETGTVW